jgi:hypothetical protein
MGSSYTSVTLRTADADGVAAALGEMGRDAYVAPADAGAVVVFDRETDEAPSGLGALARGLTSRFDCAGLAVAVGDDDVLWFGVYERGTPLDEYDSCPGYGTRHEAGPRGGDAETLCAALGAIGREEIVEGILRGPAPTFETDRHQALVEALGLPLIAVGTGYEYVRQGEVPDVDPAALLRVGDAPAPGGGG